MFASRGRRRRRPAEPTARRDTAAAATADTTRGAEKKARAAGRAGGPAAPPGGAAEPPAPPQWRPSRQCRGRKAPAARPRVASAPDCAAGRASQPRGRAATYRKEMPARVPPSTAPHVFASQWLLWRGQNARKLKKKTHSLISIYRIVRYGNWQITRAKSRSTPTQLSERASELAVSAANNGHYRIRGPAIA